MRIKIAKLLPISGADSSIRPDDKWIVRRLLNLVFIPREITANYVLALVTVGFSSKIL